MINKTETLKLIKSKVDARKNGKIKLPKPFKVEIREGVVLVTKNVKITSLIKNGNSVFFKDDTYQLRNINILDTKDLHRIMWQLITDKEKKEIALEHLVMSKTYLEG